jgi:hypothetical protein
MGGDPSNYPVCCHYFKGIPLNIQTKTVVTIHDPVKGYCLKWLLVIYEIICLGNVRVLPSVYFRILYQSYWVKLNMFCL